MDGIMSKEKESGLVMVLAATNMPWDLDDVRLLSMHVADICCGPI